jgi:hypothetical protein
VSSLRDDTRGLYVAEIAGLDSVMRAYRRIDIPTSRVAKETTKKTVEAECDCGRSLKILLTFLAEGPVLCGLCEMPFTDRDATEGER